jgi:hypothetical protein
MHSRIRRFPDPLTIPRPSDRLKKIAKALEDKARESFLETCAKLLAAPPTGNPPPPASQPAEQPTDPFIDFVQLQRKLLIALWGNGGMPRVPIETVVKTLYNRVSERNLNAFWQLVKRTRKRLAVQKALPRYEIKRKGDHIFLRVGA